MTLPPGTTVSPGRGQGRGDALVLGILAVVALVLFREPLFSDRVLYRRDIHLVRYAEIEVFVRAVAEGAWPLWNPSLSFGRPLLGDPGAQIAYPPTWLNLILQPWTYYAWFAWGHALLAAVGLYLLSRRWRLSPPASLLAALLWLFSGPLLSQVDLWHHFAGASWLPTVVLAADVALERRSRLAAVAWGVIFGLQILAGSADSCALTLAAIAVLAVAREGGMREARREWRGQLATMAVAALVATGCSAIVWLPALDQVRNAARLDLPLSVRTYWSLHPVGLLDLLYPDIWTSLPLSPRLREVLFESREPFFASLYLGAAAAGFVFAGMASAHPLRRGLILLAGISLLLSLGKHTPFFAGLAELLPPLRILRYPVKLTTLVAFCWSLLAGMGLDFWREGSWKGRRVVGVVIGLQAALVVAGLLVAAFLRQSPGGAAALLELPSGVSPQVVLGPLVGRVAIASTAAGVVVALGVARACGAPAAVSLCAAAVAALELGMYHRRPNPTAPRALVLHRPAVLRYLSAPEGRLYVYDYSSPGKTARYLGREHGYALARQPEGWDLDESSALGMQMYLAPETAGRWGLRGSFEIDYRGLYPRLLDRMSQLIRSVEGRPEHVRLLRLANVSRVIALHEEGFADLVPVATVPGLFREPIRVFGVKDPVPRTYAVGRARVADGLETLAAMMAEDFNPTREVVVPALVQPDASAAFRGTTRVVAERADRVALEADLTEPGYVVLADGYDPGWHATVDGNPVPVLRANAVFRAMPVPAGRHRVELRYRPASVLIGLSASLLTTLGMLTFVVRHRRRRQAPGALPPA